MSISHVEKEKKLIKKTKETMETATWKPVRKRSNSTRSGIRLGMRKGTPSPSSTPQIQSSVVIESKEAPCVIESNKIDIKIHEPNQKTDEILQGKSRYADVQRQFTFCEVVGRGGFSVVHRAIYKKTHEVVALKIIDKTIVRKDQLETLSREIGFVKWCEHKYLLQVYDILEDDDYIYEVLEFAPGGNLFQRITKKPLTEQQAQWVGYQVASAVYYLHTQGICHRDLKPENILLMEKDDGFNIRLVDFGLAKKFTDDVLKTPCGTFDYAPPEMLLHTPQYTQLCDIWSFGVTIFVSMCGYYPFDGNSLAENIEQMQSGDINFDDDEWEFISFECKDFIRRCLVADPTRRMNIEGVLTHQWLCGASVYSNPYFANLLKELSQQTMDKVVAPKKITIDRN
ncbi:calcium/calmodulin-dependent protein kinase type 1D, putative [Entamoeba dispar SAW760]|uniref:Calcium/calmodulin-dependent protein kinase type 1D, putative n=1 Tax=Entamoeba dispar (strain ATCC PRA-260 / SAW760) TaxID=370354 RepID=B0EGN5_ENTDS|nr:calcium/calmodulin-dependent protein kinase type 1D, putative [Entamoeba dispar SAW760]EDR26309.1 calcium/calmodulin-dependent protein kinase type 1D, putative [Entamoeba dispar SAW760]|eukprot:EDR26309.1 calcium/calmodulin-dependent protein kinase type 1D, putative [Entamoeba dispar SAW760]